MTRSHISRSCVRLWETKSTVVPVDCIISSMRARLLRWKRSSPTERISSTISTSGSTTEAIEKARRASMPEE